MDAKIKMLPNFKKGFNLYQNQQFESALELFRKYVKKIPEDFVAQLYIDRCQKVISSGWDSEHWDGINYMENK